MSRSWGTLQKAALASGVRVCGAAMLCRWLAASLQRRNGGTARGPARQPQRPSGRSSRHSHTGEKAPCSTCGAATADRACQHTHFTVHAASAEQQQPPRIWTRRFLRSPHQLAYSNAATVAPQQNCAVHAQYNAPPVAALPPPALFTELFATSPPVHTVCSNFFNCSEDRGD